MQGFRELDRHGHAAVGAGNLLGHGGIQPTYRAALKDMHDHGLTCTTRQLRHRIGNDA